MCRVSRVGATFPGVRDSAKPTFFFRVGRGKGNVLESGGRRGGGEEGDTPCGAPSLYSWFRGLRSHTFFVFSSEALSSRPPPPPPPPPPHTHTTPCPATPCWRPRSPCSLCPRPPRRQVRGEGGERAARRLCGRAPPPHACLAPRPPPRALSMGPCRSSSCCWRRQRGGGAAGGGGRGGGRRTRCGARGTSKRARRRGRPPLLPHPCPPSHHTHTHTQPPLAPCCRSKVATRRT